MWIVYDISPTTFNVLSELTGRVIEAIVLFALGLAYPYLVWETIKRGVGVPLESIVAPPLSLGDALLRFCQGGSRLLIITAFSILAVATLSHSAANAFLEFIEVEVGSNDTYFLSSSPGGVPSYALLGDQYAFTRFMPAFPGARLLQQADSIAQGLSRFSIFPPDWVNLMDKQELIPGLLNVERSTLSAWWLPNVTAKALPEHLNVQCRSPYETTYSMISTSNGEYFEFENGTVVELISVNYAINETQSESVTKNWETYIPDCDYESPVPYKTIQKDTGENSWEVLDWSKFTVESNYDSWVHQPFGARATNGDLWWDLLLSFNDTELALTRESWQFGRRIREGVSFAMGVTFEESWGEPNMLKPDGVEFQVENSVITGSRQRNGIDDEPFYTISSWSKNCPVVSTPSGNLSVASFPMKEVDFKTLPTQASKASGCLIDVLIQCDFLFPQDNLTGTDEETPYCYFGNFAVTLLSGIEVDPFMLAAYAGIAARNNALGTLDTMQCTVALNSIAAAYVMTREVVAGTVAVEGVRASFDIGFICFMLLPLLFIVPFLAFLKKEKPSIPQSVWEVLVLGKEQESVPPRPGSDSAFPPCPRSLRYGLIINESTESDHFLGLGSLFTSLERALSQRKSDGAEQAPPEPAQAPNQPPDPPEEAESESLEV